MRMIRHKNPGKHPGIAKHVSVFKALGGGASCIKVIEKTLAINSGGRYQIDMVG